MRRFIATAAFLLATTGLVQAEDLWSTAVAERPTDGWKMIHRFIDKLNDPTEKLRFPVAVTFTWQYDGANGLPVKPDSDAMYKLEDILDESVDRRGEGKLALVSTGNNLRTWIYYVKSEASFRKVLEDAASTARLKLRVSSKSDSGWTQVEEFKKGLRRP